MHPDSSWSCFRKGDSYSFRRNLLFARGIFLFLIFFATDWHSAHFANRDVYAAAKVLIFKQITTWLIRISPDFLGS